MVILTNRISNSVITKEIKENFPVRMGFRMLDKRGSIVTLDTPGAEWLNGKGDMLLLRESDVKRELSTFISFNFPICIRIRSGVERVQGTFLSPDECMAIKEENNIDYDSVVTPEKKMKYLEKLQK